MIRTATTQIAITAAIPTSNITRRFTAPRSRRVSTELPSPQ